MKTTDESDESDESATRSATPHAAARLRPRPTPRRISSGVGASAHRRAPDASSRSSHPGSASFDGASCGTTTYHTLPGSLARAVTSNARAVTLALNHARSFGAIASSVVIRSSVVTVPATFLCGVSASANATCTSYAVSERRPVTFAVPALAPTASDALAAPLTVAEEPAKATAPRVTGRVRPAPTPATTSADVGLGVVPASRTTKCAVPFLVASRRRVNPSRDTFASVAAPTGGVASPVSKSNRRAGSTRFGVPTTGASSTV